MSVAGVSSVNVGAGSDEVQISFDPNKTTLQALRQAVIDAGYEVVDAHVVK